MPMSPGGTREAQILTRKLFSRRRILLAGSALLLILLVLGGNTLLLRHLLKNQIAQRQNWARHTREVQIEIENTESLLADAETSQRGFLYTGDERYLAPYKQAITEIDQHIDNLARLTADNPQQEKRIPELRTLTHTKLAELARTIFLYRSGRHEEALALVRTDIGLTAMSHIRILMDQMQQDETMLVTSHAEMLQTSANGMAVYNLLNIVFVLGSLVFIAYFVHRELKHREKYLDEIWRREEWYRVTIESIGDAVICTDVQGNISLLNLVAERLTGWTQLEALGKSIESVLRIVDSTTRKPLENPMEEAVKLDRVSHLPVNCLLLRRDGREVFIADSVAPIHTRERTIAGSIIVFRDVSALHVSVEKLAYASQHDSLTGLPNRTLLEDRVIQAISLARRQRGQTAILFLDLDNFKAINDSLGHLIGDKLLQSIAKRLLECVRDPDTVSRQGGDEFVILLQEMRNPEDAAATATRLLQAVAEVHSIEGNQIYITGSIGVSVYPGDGEDTVTLFKNADTAMYQAKKNGRQNFQFFGPEINHHAIERYSIEQGLRRALDREEFTLHYQPIIDLRSSAIVGAEALLRWTHPTMGLIPPEKFIPVAEASGLIIPIGAWVMQQACSQAMAWANDRTPIGIMAVNVSAVQFRNPDFQKALFTSLDNSGLDPQFLELEMTESVLMKHPEITGPILKALRESGVQVSVDDFGTGYSSLSYLQQFQVDALKIDQSFIRHIRNGQDDAPIVNAIIRMGQSLNLRVIAEGVETLEDLAFLKAHGCDEAQGYYFSHPVPPEQFAMQFQMQ